MRPRVAIVGAGVSGLVCAWMLHETHDIVVFEAESWTGGHTHTVDVDEDGRTLAVDTGFIVFNENTYPNFIRILERLGVAAQPSEMSFSVHDESSGLEWNGQNLRTIFVQKRNLLRPSFLGMLRDVMRFNREARALAKTTGDERTLASFLEDGRYGRAFREHYLIPMGAAIWSTHPDEMLGFPARFFARFFENHGMLEVDDRPRWFVVQGGSRTYVEAMTRGFKDRIRQNTPVRSVRRADDHVLVKVDGAEAERFDHVILASHADQSLAMLEDADEAEREILGAIPYSKNRTTLHTGSALLPKRRAAVASWNYRVSGPEGGDHGARLCYHMNTLQSLEAKRDYCVSLNSDASIDPGDRLGSWDYEHPLFTVAGADAQQRWGEIDGRRRTHFCGAYWRNGFHEDGVVSALRVCEKFGSVL